MKNQIKQQLEPFRPYSSRLGMASFENLSPTAFAHCSKSKCQLTKQHPVRIKTEIQYPPLLEMEERMASYKEFKESPSTFLDRLKMSKELQKGLMRLKKKRKNNYISCSPDKQRKAKIVFNSTQKGSQQSGYRQKKQKPLFDSLIPGEGVKDILHSSQNSNHQSQNSQKKKSTKIQFRIKDSKVHLRKQISKMISQESLICYPNCAKSMKSYTQKGSNLQESRELGKEELRIKIQLKGTMMRFEKSLPLDRLVPPSFASSHKGQRGREEKRSREGFRIEGWKRESTYDLQLSHEEIL